ncbi:MAG: ROK family protein [Mycoplasmoidaceae bacterium]
MNILTIDIGGMTTKIAVVDTNEKTLIKKYDAIKSQKGNSLKWLFDFIDDYIDFQYDAISICVPGIYLSKEQKIVLAGNLNYKDFYIIKECQRFTEKPVFVTNDANAAAMGEFWKAKNHYQNALFYTIGTGIGGAIIIDGKIYEGSNGFAGEFGHGNFMQTETKCNCGNRNCIEPLSSATGITKNLIKYAKAKPNSRLGRIYFKNENHFAIKDLLPLIKKQDSYVMKALCESLTPLINNISVMIFAFNPDVVIIGGGPSQIGRPLLNLIKTSLYANKNPTFYKKAEIILSKYGNDAAWYGCAYNALVNLKP